ncbi:ABC transporter ATP-binding protein [Vagococcus carniphilus]|uniref:ABC transporter ATP-binding protein n=1 Tax=Vagococcus carniphilus TaxID=218144 RepID=A0AAW8U2R6_9ENTE|nr:ABC transporter ATP-binding protein [Vagococcus carniphilus]MDT2829409.1 ABC transporter ATP-binding protein [Vagococcus carniphilus]MDT2833384.1 ABC transporter ATP-binding protein [Vagococcus carniphilus]MDT2838868.1 ABC transporter ATP-binding protein [Vagococcus carniphilus]MDT2852926.1 ABC transporter ATP-binding protein [Vagococcus carniphilus]
MISISQGSLTYGEKTILSELNLNIKKGECVVVCGESGSGKSSLIRVLNGLVPELYDGQISGEFKSLTHQLPTEQFNDYVKEIGVVFQNPKTQFFMNDVYSELAFVMENYGYSREEMIGRIETISKSFNLSNFWNRKMTELSGGEKQRVAFASACMISHELFLLDEPSSNLDEKNIDILTDYLIWLKNNKQTILIAEHRLYYLLPIVDRFILMKNGRIVGNYTKQELLTYSDQELSCLGLRTLRKPQINLIEKIDTLNKSTNQLRCENLVYAYQKEKPIIEMSEMLLQSNSVTGLIGENGAGKTTLSHLLTGLLKPTAGSIFYNGKKQSRKDLIKKSFLVMQDVNFQLFFETVEKEITAKAKRLDLFEMVVETLQLDSLLDRHPQTLSGGEKQRVAIASAVLSGKEIIILDEPTSGLDLVHMNEVSLMIKKLNTFDIIFLIISHDKEFINRSCHQIIELSKK